LSSARPAGPRSLEAGFHSQAGWLAFNAVALGFVALTIRGHYFQSGMMETSSSLPNERDLTTAYLGPFVAITATAMITGAFLCGHRLALPAAHLRDWAVLWIFRKRYTRLKWTWSWPAIAHRFRNVRGMAGIDPGGDEPQRWMAGGAPVGAVLLGGSLAALSCRGLRRDSRRSRKNWRFRGFLTRRIVQSDFQNVSAGHVLVVVVLDLLGVVRRVSRRDVAGRNARGNVVLRSRCTTGAY
jgi:hypothetical protein